MHVKKFTDWLITEGAVKDKLMEIAEKACSMLNSWFSEPKKPLNQMTDEEREDAISVEIDKFFEIAPKEYDKEFLKGNREAIVSAISALLS